MVDYSKWKKIEISDDEDDTHPNIDTPSLFRWRHQARKEREFKFNEERKTLENRRQNLETLSQEDFDKAKAELADIEEKEKDLNRRARLRPYNVDSIGKETWDKTHINILQNKINQDVSSSSSIMDDEDFSDFQNFIQVNEKYLKEYSFLNGVRGSRRFILDHADLVSQYSLDWLTMRCVDYKINGSIALMKHVAYQAVIIETILDIAKSIGRGCDPRNCISIFFDRYKDNCKLIDGVIEEQVVEFLKRVDKGADYRIEKAYEEQQENKEPILGPGGLDPNEVFQELDSELQNAFIDRDLDKLYKAISKYSLEEGKKILLRCVDAGLWMKCGNADLEEYEEIYEKEQKRLAALDNELEPELPSDEVPEVEVEDDFEIRDVFSKLIINPNREIKEQPGLFSNKSDDEDDDNDVNKNKENYDDERKEEETSSDESSINDDYLSGDSDDNEDDKGKKYKEYEFDLDQFEGRTLTNEEQRIRDQLLEMVEKNKKDTEKKAAKKEARLKKKQNIIDKVKELRKKEEKDEKEEEKEDE